MDPLEHPQLVCLKVCLSYESLDECQFRIIVLYKLHCLQNEPNQLKTNFTLVCEPPQGLMRQD